MGDRFLKLSKIVILVVFLRGLLYYLGIALFIPIVDPILLGAVSFVKMVAEGVFNLAT